MMSFIIKLNSIDLLYAIMRKWNNHSHAKVVFVIKIKSLSLASWVQQGIAILDILGVQRVTDKITLQSLDNSLLLKRSGPL